MKSLCVGLAVCACLASGAQAGVGLVTENLTPLGTDLIGAPVPLGGSLVLEFESLKGVVRDYADPAAPAWVGAVTFNFHMFDQVLHRDGWLIGLHPEYPLGATLVDMHDPAAPSVVTSDFAPYHFTTAHLLPGAVYLMSEDLFIVYDLATPAQPVFSTIALLPPRTASRWPAPVGDRLYLVESSDRLRIFGTATATTPVDLGSVVLPAQRIEAMVTAGGHLQVVQLVAGELVLATYDVTAPLAPALTSQVPVTVEAQESGLSLVADDGILYVGSAAGGLQAFSLADPAHPVAGFALPDTVQQLGLSEVGLFVRAGQTVRVLSRGAHDEIPVVLNEHTEYPRAADLVTNGRVSVTLPWEGVGVDILDLANPTIIARAGGLEPGVKGLFLELEGDRLAVFQSSAMRLVNIADPAHPVTASITPYPYVEDPPLCGWLHGDRLAVGLSLPGRAIYLYDVADPAHPDHVASVEGEYHRVAFDDTRLAATEDFSGRVEVYDVTEFDSPGYLATLPETEVADLDVVDGRVFVLTPGLLAIYTVDAEHGVHLVGSIALPHTVSLTVAGTHAYVNSNRGLEVVDIADPTAPVIVGWLVTTSGIGEVAAADGIVHLRMPRGTVVLRDDTWAATPVPADVVSARRLLAPAPNPFNPATTVSFDVGRAEPLRLTVHDLAGRLVAELASGTFAPGRHSVTWHGADRDGRPAASGVYVFRLTGENGAACRRATLVR